MAANRLFDPKYLKWLAILAGSVWLGLNLLTLLRYPIISCDEAFYSMAGARVWGDIIEKPRTILVPDYYEALLPYGRINIIGIGLYGLLLGVNIFSARLWGLTGWIVGIIGVYWTGKRLFGQKAATWAAALMAVAWLCLGYGHNGKPHIWTAAIAVWSLGWLKAGLENPSPKRLLWVTAFPTLMLDFHLNSMHFIIANFLFAALLFIWRKQARYIIWLALGIVAAAPFLLAMRLIPKPDILSFGSLSNLAIYATPGGTAQSGNMVKDFLSNWAIWRNILDFFPWWYGLYVRPPLYEGIPQAILFILGLASAWRSRDTDRRLLAAYYIFTSFTFAILQHHKWDNYGVIWMPLLILLAVVGALWAGERVQSRLKSAAPWRQQFDLGHVILAGLFTLYIGGDVYLMRHSNKDGYLEPARQLAELIPEDATVLAANLWWFPLNEAAFVDEFSVINRYQPTAEFLLSPLGPEAFVRKVIFEDFHFDYVIADDLIGCENVPNEGALAITKAVEEECHMIDTFSYMRPDGNYQLTSLYQCSDGELP